MNWDTEELIDIIDNDETMYWLAKDIVKYEDTIAAKVTELRWMLQHVDSPIDIAEVNWEAVIDHFLEES